MLKIFFFSEWSLINESERRLLIFHEIKGYLQMQKTDFNVL